MVPEGVCKNGWIRDLFVQISDLVITRHADKESVERILQFLGLKDQYQIRESEIGEGGMIRISGNDVLVHEKFINDPLIQEIKNKGFNVVFVPMPSRWQYEILPKNTNPKRRKIAESVIVNEHIDRQIGLILLPDGKKLLVVNPTYYSVYKENIFQPEMGIDEIAKKNCWEVIVLNDEDEENMSVNFMQLRDGRIIMPSPSQQTINRLNERLGTKVIVVPKELVEDERKSGSLNCRINQFMI